MPPETKILLIVCLFGGLALAAPWIAWKRLKALEAKFGRVLLVRGINGEQAAKIILLRGEIPQVDVDESHILFADNYSPGEPAIKLSSKIYHGKRLFDIARAGRLAGHALQHRDRKLGSLASWDAFMVLWGNAWPLLLVALLVSHGRPLITMGIFTLVAGTVTLVHFLKHAQVRDAARRAHRALAEAKLLDGHPEEEIEAAFLVTRLDHLALPFTKTWMGVMFR
jgi:Zn-dependent membrane protease YugP